MTWWQKCLIFLGGGYLIGFVAGVVQAAHPGWDTEYARGCATGYLLYWLINDS